MHMAKTHFLLGNLSISEPSLGILQNFQRRSALPNIKYNCAVLFLRQVYYLFNYAPKTKNSTEKKFLIDFNVKTLKCIFWPCRISKYFLNFTQCEIVRTVDLRMKGPGFNLYQSFVHWLITEM